MTPERMGNWALADYLTLLSGEVREGRSYGGTLAWERLAQPEERDDDEALTYSVVSVSMVDTSGKDEVRQREVGKLVEADVALSEQTNTRAQTIRERMTNDIAKANPMLSEGSVYDLVEHGMFHVEHLLAEVEGLRSDTSLGREQRIAEHVSRETEG